MRKIGLVACACAALCAPPQALASTIPQAEMPGFWSTPTIAGYGKIHFPANGIHKPDPRQHYKIVLALTQGSKDPGDVNVSLDHVARTVNLYVVMGVPLDHLQGRRSGLWRGDGDCPRQCPLPGRFRGRQSQPATARGAGQGGGRSVGLRPGDGRAWLRVRLDRSQRARLSVSGLTTVTVLQHQGYALMPE